MKRSLTGLYLLAVLGVRAGSPPVKVSLRSSWPAPPPLIEALETLSSENPEAFFPLLDRLTDPALLPSLHTMSPKAVYQSSLQIAATHGYLREPGAFTAVEMGLALHSATPKIEAFYNHYWDRHIDTSEKECGSWVEWYGEMICDVETLVRLAGTETIDPSTASNITQAFDRPQLLAFDHVYPPLSRALTRPSFTAIFYASLTSPNFRELHTFLLSASRMPNPHVEYVLRYIPPRARDATMRNYLSGYGVALDLKKTDYLAIDDRNIQNKVVEEGTQRHAEMIETEVDHILALIHNYPGNSTFLNVKTALTELELEEIGAQATQLIADSPEPLLALQRLSQNFPKYATSLARRVIVNSSLDEEIHANSLKAQGGTHLFWLNGATVPDKDISPLGLLRLLKKERAIMRSLTSLGLSRPQTLELITHPHIAAAQGGKNVLDGIFDASDRPEGGAVITWWNDLEKDSRYSQWSTSLFTILRPTYPGQFPNVKLNLYNVVLVLDLSHTSSLTFIAGPVANIINRNFPLRFGIVPLAETEDGTRMARLFYYLVHNYGRKKTLSFIKAISQSDTLLQPQAVTVSWNVVRAEYKAFTEAEAPAGSVVADLDAILDGSLTPFAPFDKVSVYSERLGTSLSASATGHAFINGKHFKLDDEFLQHMQMEISQQMQFLQEQVYSGKITDEHNDTMSTYFYDQPTTSQRRNQYIYPTAAPGSLRIFNLFDVFARNSFRTSPADYIYPSDSQSIPLTCYVIADLDSDAGLKLLKASLSSVKVDSLARISFIHNPTRDLEGIERPVASWLMSHLFSKSLLSTVSPSQLQRALGMPSPLDSGAQAPFSHDSHDEALLNLTGGVSISEFSSESYESYLKGSRLVARELHVAPGDSVVLVNGRIVGPIGDGNFGPEDFKALEIYEHRKRVEPVMKGLEAIFPSAKEQDRATYARLISMASSVINSVQLPDASEFSLLDAPQRPRQRQYRLLDSEYTAFESGDNSTALYHIAVIMDPLSETAQRWSSLLEWLANVPDTFIEVHLHPARHKEIPLKRFYRYNISPSLSFNEDGNEVAAVTTFQDLPTEPIYTLAMDVPSSWLVRPREALYDLDNIQLGNLSPGDQGVDATFDLDYIVVEGHARETSTNSAPRGVQLQLIRGSSGDSIPIADTHVVANLGYLQFKAKPGVFKLEIREGRGREVFKMDSVGNEGWDSPTVEEGGSDITLTSFEGLTLFPRLSRKLGMEKADVLDEGEKADGTFGGLFGDVASRVTSFFKPRDNALTQTNKQAEINIFTVASGLLYERFVSIMILSVLRNTKSTVKFWFIENFLSPSFLEFIPHLAETYKFDYELVTYKWPSWLRQQTEKQRIIWAYKILFLDVLFPMDLKKVIFVDADQIVRADLKELVDLDLQGAPYGYTPMGDDNTDMEGFRFWKTGYWKEFLQGRPYHISALYVIDLVRFRQLAAGDILRGQYQQLSADPNSLANLDQDLPNNLQREVPIYSLHEDWLWCETWCSKDRLHRAKTIDLCQNPLTKEPKLARARQIPEWEEYDSEIARFARKLAEEGVIHSGMATADTNILANAGAAPAPSTNADSEEGRVDETNTPIPESPRDEL